MAWFIVGVLAVILVFGYFGLPIFWWTIAAGLLTGYLSIIAEFSSTTNIVLGALFVVIAAILNIPALRRAVISNHVLALYRRILPDMSQTEKEAIDAGTVWWDADLFSGKPDWDKLLKTPEPRLSAEEQAFLDGPVEELCAMCDEWEISHERQDLPPHVWQFIKDKGLLGMIIPKQYGGLGFSALAHSAVVMKLSTRSSTAAISVMVPNSLGPGELLLHYGTDQQKSYYLPRLAKGLEIPCFALTSPEAGSDAASIPDFGVVCKGTWQGKEVLGMRVTWDKRYITLGPVATLLGLAFRLYDPEKLLSSKVDLGITCALVPTNTPGVNIGRRHLPLNAAFQNGPNWGKDVFMPLDWIIGGPEYAGKGWMMLMGCLAAGRAISLPTSAVGGVKALTRFVGAYARVRSQFKTPIGKLEGVEEALGRIAAHCYMMDATRVMTAGAVDMGEKPAVLSAIAKYHMTERARACVNDGMDIVGGKGICLGPNNWIGRGYQMAPIAITVEGANILTRTLIIFGQGAIRCHPYVLREMRAAKEMQGPEAAREFDDAFTSHIGHVLRNGVRTLIYGLTRASFAPPRLAPLGRIRLPRRHVDARDGRRAQAQGKDFRPSRRCPFHVVSGFGCAEALRRPGAHARRPAARVLGGARRALPRAAGDRRDPLQLSGQGAGDALALDHLPARRDVPPAARLAQPRVRENRARARRGARAPHRRHVCAEDRGGCHRQARSRAPRRHRLRADRREAAQGGEERQDRSARRNRPGFSCHGKRLNLGGRVRAVEPQGSAAQAGHQGGRFPAGLRPRRDRRLARGS
jgi:acyl-CoA dehydrogenase